MRRTAELSARRPAVLAFASDDRGVTLSAPVADPYGYETPLRAARAALGEALNEVDAKFSGRRHERKWQPSIHLLAHQVQLLQPPLLRLPRRPPTDPASGGRRRPPLTAGPSTG